MKKYPFIFAVILLLSIEASAQNVKFLTYNIRLNAQSDGDNAWNVRKIFLAEQIKFYAPDIVGTQEGLPEQISYLNRELTDDGYVGVGREGKTGEHTAIFYNKNRFEVLDQATFWLSATPRKVSMGWDAAYLRICTYALFHDKKTKSKFWVFNLHLDNEGEVARSESVSLIKSEIEKVNHPIYPVVLMGDFNALPESEVIERIKNDFTSAEDLSICRPFGPSGTFNGFDFCKPVTRKIDYIFLKKPDAQSTVSKYAVLSDSKDCRYPSDHLPVFVTIQFNKKK